MLGLKILAICGVAVFMIKGVVSIYADAQKDIIKQNEVNRTQIVLNTVTPKQDATEYYSLVDGIEDNEDAYLLAKIAMAEEEGEDVEGKALVMLVVLNRVQSNEFPNSISEVIFQEGQFSPVSNGRYDSVEPNNECYEAVELIQIEKWDESQGALYFESKSASDWHKNHLQFLFQHGNHYFYKDKE